jgi:cytochrome c oxidase subunit 4
MSEHVVSKKTYFAVFAVLMVGTAVTVQAAFINMGFLNNLVALGIAVVKATLVVLFFMHVRYSSRLTWIVVVSGLVWLIIMFAFTLSDYDTRGWLPYPGK